MKYTIEELNAYAKRYGFVYQGSEIYGGLANTWDYGPLGVSLKNNLKQFWWKRFVSQNKLNVGIDSSILLNPKTWEATGHVSGFKDPLMDCKVCKSRHRADNLIAQATHNEVDADGWDYQKMYDYIIEHKIKCPVCGSFDYTEIREFNLMFKTSQGVTTDSTNEIYLRPETAQGIFLNFKNVVRTSRKKVPFGIGQIGKSFRNEITPGNFVFRTREFEQMELEFFCVPGTEIEWFNYWKDFAREFLLEVGLKSENIQFYDHAKEKLSFYSNATTDVLYNFPWGFDELWGIASRTDYDLKRHQEYSGENLEYLDPITNESYLPYVIEPSLGVERLFLAVLLDNLEEQTLENGETRTLLSINKNLAPYQVNVLPLVKKYHTEKSEEVYDLLMNDFTAFYDDAGNIGRRYRRADAIGTPFCVTIDNQTLEDNTVTIRDRDSMEQVRVNIKELKSYLKSQFE
ncbi:MAG: glycine--tRNA ligase [Candidatus Izemoplasmatales bacterium]|nr:glycine--tRNA ligase [Candidatus Izemoplasmatales bacterium]MDD4070078.1 glycine--tRNA ligase [Candidatus Izemoplasmatales bacterium]MDY0139092.1 glycine--tRNA ligase [Candidatus Izemoplasmatales bacterium]